MKILMSNLGYLRGIDGTLGQHFRYAHRHIYCSVATQKKSLKQLEKLIEREDPDICCFVEIDKGSSDLANFNQLEALISDHYVFYDIENKYGTASRLRSLPFSRGKSNAFLAKRAFDYEKIYFTHGTKRLIYKIQIDTDISLFFAHFSLKKDVRVQQLRQVRQLLQDTPGEHIVLGDFNILMNDKDVPTFTFHRIKKALDLCICSESLAPRVKLQVIAQPYSDHSALLLEVVS
jgi:exonuclease III